MPTDFRTPITQHLDAELDVCSSMHANYFRQLMGDGFDRAEAFQLVRDHHWLFHRTSLALPDDQVESWVVTSSAQPPRSASVSPISKLSTPEL